MKDNLKTCRTCGERKPIRDFPTPRMRQCTACKRQELAKLDLPIRSVLSPGPDPLAHLDPTARRILYQRLRLRKLAELKREALAKLGLTPSPPRNPNPFRRCRVCKHEFPFSLMANQGRAKICLGCEATQLRTPPVRRQADQDDERIAALYRDYCLAHAIKAVWPPQADMTDLFWRARRMLRAGETDEAIAAWMLTFIQEARAYEQAKERRAKQQPE